MPKLYNTLTKELVDFNKPINDNEVGLYTCGPTVYHFAHIGNLRTYIFEDILRRVLEYDGYKVKHGMNITDVGHLVGDGDEGQDKLEVGAKREGKHPLEIAKFYESKFFEDLKELNILSPTTVIRATESIEDQIAIIKILQEKGFAYKGNQAVYFDTSKLKNYGKLSGQKLSDKKTGAREDIIVDADKKNPADFALWFFLTGRYKNHVLHWPSPWGEGFPGWHIECSAISRKILGQPFDIHTGGVDHIGTHHTNEIAQSEAAFDLPLAKIWMHGEFLLVNSGRMGKSENNFITLDVVKKKYRPLDYRYLCLTAHYRSELDFSWDSMEYAHRSLNRLYRFVKQKADTKGKILEKYHKWFIQSIDGDLSVPAAVGIMWRVISDPDENLADKLETLFEFDKVFGLNLKNPPEIDQAFEPDDEQLRILLDERIFARHNKDYTHADVIRKQIEDLGYAVTDAPDGKQIVKKKVDI